MEPNIISLIFFESYFIIHMMILIFIILKQEDKYAVKNERAKRNKVYFLSKYAQANQTSNQSIISIKKNRIVMLRYI